jgi:iron complex outermembrane receptor protein
MKAFRMALLAGSLPLGAWALVAATPASASDRDVRSYHLPAQSLADALRNIAVQSGRSIAAPAELLDGKRAPALDGQYSVEAAVRLILSGTGLRARPVADGLVIERGNGGAGHTDPATTDASDVIVTGSRIRGAPGASALIVISREAMRDSGRTSTADVVRAIPQSFDGGQNPGVGFNVPADRGSDLGGGSSVNLRGIGSDATLTLLDGHRLSYSAINQSIDIAAIPFGAIDRLDIVPDGASTIYGSDAVAGVVNVVLRRRFEGVETSAKLGGSTDGGNFAQQYALTAGTNWANGGVLISYEFDHNTGISSNQRDYAVKVRPNLTLYPAASRHAAIARVYQALAPNLTLSVEGLYGRRWTASYYPLNAAGDPSISRGNQITHSRSFGVSPTLDLDLPGAWKLSLSGSYGGEQVDYGVNYVFGTTPVNGGSGFYRNRGSSAELSGNGDLFALPGGTSKLAVGLGYRRNTFRRVTGAATNTIDHAQSSYYGFGELSLPLVPHLVLSAAVRYERYPGIASVATPKFGAIFSPSSDFDVKASWGKSFRAPTLYQQYQPGFSFLAGAGLVGGSGFPAGSTVLFSQGGNAGLKPERSTNWSATVDFHPRALAGFTASLSYFSIDYRDRIVTPIPFLSKALTDPANSSYVTLAPSAAAQAAFIAGAATFTNATGSSTYDPATVVAIVRDTNVNAGSQRVRGVDLLAAYQSAVGRGSAHASLDLSYLVSQQQITAAQPVTQLAGILFSPPHLRGRAEIGWQQGRVGITGDLNFIGPVRDTRAGLPTRIAGMTPIDLTLRYRTPPKHGVFGGMDVILSVQNLFNEKPSVIATTVYTDTPYDSTNYSPFGRVVSLSLSKKW